MGSPYTSQSASGYNSSPPADDGTAVASNKILWSTIKTKLNDPVKTLADAINSAVSTAFGLTLSGGSVISESTNYQVLSSDQGKLIRTTAAITVTTPDATSVTSPFVFAVLNSHASADLTLDGSGAQTVNGAANVTIPAGQGCIVFTDGSNWFVIGSLLTTAALTVASLTSTGAVSGTTGTFSGALKSSSASGGVGYATGAGGTVTQITSKTTGVTINKTTGQITTTADNIAEGASANFTVTNSSVAATDVIVVNLVSGNTAARYQVSVDAVASGSFVIRIKNNGVGGIAEAIVIGFAVIKGVTA